MKSLFPYLVMIVLFLAGTRLVNRQQTYTRSLQKAATLETASLTNMLATSESQSLQLTSNTDQPAPARVLTDIHKRVLGEPLTGVK